MIKGWFSVCAVFGTIITTLCWHYDKFGEGASFPIVWILSSLGLMLLTSPAMIPILAEEDLKRGNKEL